MIGDAIKDALVERSDSERDARYMDKIIELLFDTKNMEMKTN